MREHTEDDLNYYFEAVSKLYAAGKPTTFADIRGSEPMLAAHAEELKSALDRLVEQGRLKLEEVEVGRWSEEPVYEMRYIPA